MDEWAEVDSARLLRQYGRARSRLLSLRCPIAMLDMPGQRVRYGSWERRYVFCCDVAMVLDRMPARERRVLVQLVAAGRSRRDLARELNCTFRTLDRIKAVALRRFATAADARGLLDEGRWSGGDSQKENGRAASGPRA